MKGFAQYAAVAVGAVLVIGLLFSAVFRGPGDVSALLLSGVVVVAVQLCVFWLGRVAGQNNPFARMGTGLAMRFLTVIVYAILVTMVLKLPIVAALLSMATFFFVTTLIDPLLTKS